MRTRIVLLASAGVAGAGGLIAMEQGVQTPAAEATNEVVAESVVTQGVITMHPVAPGAENQVIFATQANGAHYGEQLRKRLADPEEREVVRSEMRAMFDGMNPGVAEVLNLDAEKHAALLDLLADQHIQMLDQSFADAAGGLPSLEAHLQLESTRLEGLRTLLGDEGVERYQHYQSTLGERMQVEQLNARLDAHDKLDAEQKTQLIALYKEKNRRDLAQDALTRGGMRRLEAPNYPDRESMENALRRAAMLDTVESNQAILHRMGDSNRWLAEHAAEFLSPSQIAALERSNAAQEAAMKQAVENLRVQAGLDRTIPDASDPGATEPRRRPVSGDISYVMTFTVGEAEPVTVNHSGPNQEPATFRLNDELSVEAVAVLFDDNFVDTQLTFLEHTASGARRLEGGYHFAQRHVTRPDLAPLYGGGEMLVTGRKVYRLKFEMRPEG